MAIATINNEALTRLDLIIPRWGLWTCDAQLEGLTAPTVGASITLDIGGIVRTGTVTRSGSPYGQARCRVIGGANKLDTAVLDGKDYGQVTLTAIVADVLRDAGETIGSLSPLNALVVPQWQRLRERAWNGLQRAMRMAPDLDLWCERSGALSVRQTTWTRTINVSSDYRGIVPQEKSLVLFSDTADIEPGVRVSTTQGDFNVERVQYILDPNDDRSALRANCWYT